MKLKLREDYNLRDLFGYLKFSRCIKIIKYNNKLKKRLKFTNDDIKKFNYANKIIKPIANTKMYIPIINRIIFNNNHNLKEVEALFIEYCNKNQLIPQINSTHYLLKELNEFKLSYNGKFLKALNDKEESSFNKKLIDFCQSYGKKVKEITLLDNFLYEEKYFDKLKYIIIHSNINKIEDRYFEQLKTTLFLYLYSLKLPKELKDDENNEKIIDIIKGLKSYSLYFEEDKINSNTIKELCNTILYNGKNIEELKITKINKSNSIYFINTIKYMKNLKSLSISSLSDDELLFNEISNVIEENSMIKLEMNVHNFQEGINIIKKNNDSLNELTIKINGNVEGDNILIIKTLSNITNLKKLKIIADFQIFDDETIKYLSFKKIKYLEIPLYIQKYIFDFNSFFEKIPNLKKLIFYGINIIDNEEIRQENINIMSKFKSNYNFCKFIKKIKFLNCKKSSSFFVYNFIKIISQNIISQNIEVLKIENCDFDKSININKLFELISNFKNIRNMKLNFVSFEEEQKLDYQFFNNFIKLEKLYLKPIIHDSNYNIRYLPFIAYISKTCKYLTEIGLSPKRFDPNIIKLLSNFKLLQKINILNDNMFSEEDNMTFPTTKIYDYVCNYFINFRDVNMRGLFNIPKISINDYFHDKKQGNTNKDEKYFSYQKLFSKNILNKYNTIAYFSQKEKAFILNKKD